MDDFNRMSIPMQNPTYSPKEYYRNQKINKKYKEHNIGRIHVFFQILHEQEVDIYNNKDENSLRFICILAYFPHGFIGSNNKSNKSLEKKNYGGKTICSQFIRIHIEEDLPI